MGLTDDLNNASEEASGLGGIFKEIQQSMSGINVGLQDATSNFKSLGGIAEKLRNHHAGIDKLTKTQLKDLKGQVAQNKLNLRTSRDILATRIRNLKEQQIEGKLTKTQTDELYKSLSAHDQITHQLENQSSELNGINKQLSSTQGIADKVGKSSLTSWLSPIKIISKLISFLVGSFTEMDAKTGDLAKNMNLTYNEASKSREEMYAIAKHSGDAALTTNKIQEAFVGISKELGISGKFSKNMSSSFKEDVVTMTKLKNQAGFTSKEVQGIQKYSLAMGTSAKKNTKEFLAQAKISGLQKGLNINNKDLLKNIAETSNAIQISTQGGASGLAEAAVQAKALGSNLETVDSLANKLLDFESSITAELEAELLVGKNINLEKARQAALDNDLATVAEEIANQIGSAAEFSKMNRIQQEAMAKAVGLTREELAGTLMEQEAIKSIGAETLDDAKEKFDTMVEQHGLAYAMGELGNEELARQFEQQSAQELAVETQAALMDGANEFLGTFRHIRDTMKEWRDYLVDALKNSVLLKGVFIAIGGIIAAKMVLGVVDTVKGLGAMLGLTKKVATAEKAGGIAAIVKGAWSSLGAIPGIGPALAGAAIGAGVGYLASQFTMDDGVIPGGYGKRVLSTPEGSINFNDNDTIVAGTDLMGNKNKSKNQIAAPTPSGVDMAQTNALIQELITVIKTTGGVTLDGQKVGDALNLGSYKLQ